MKKLYQIFLTCLMSGMLSGLGSLKAQTGITGSVTTPPCNNNGVLSVTVTGLTAPVSYTYANYISNQTFIHANINSLTNNLTNISGYQSISLWNNPNIWYVTASDGVNTVNGSYTITPAFQDSIKVIPGSCPSPSTLQAINFVGGTAPFSCIWTNVTTNLTYNTNPALVPAGNYTVQITDAAGCMVSSAPGFTSNIYVQNFSSINFTINGTSANCTNGSATVTTPIGGTAPYTYLWNNGAVSQSISGLTTGQYNCTVTDALGCANTSWYFVGQAVTI
ncbi:MAG: hypothetical protein IT236_10840, partial [Bacteroidia bacterium]|nr:hypothetical protein [Bacteroidia bacterium]